MALSCSLVVPTYNEEKYLGNLLRSVKTQSVTPLEVIVVDASTDKTRDIALQHGCVILNQDVKKVSWARRRGFEAAKGDIVISSDADTILAPGFVEAATEALEDSSIVAVFGPAHLSDGPIGFRLASRFLFPVFLRFSLLIRKPNLNGFNFACRRNAYIQSGGFNDQLLTGEDVDLALRLKNTGRIRYVPAMLVYTSGRRIQGMGGWRFMLHHTVNFFKVATGRRGSSDFKPYR